MIVRNEDGIMRNEAFEALEKYLSQMNKTGIRYYGSGAGARHFADIFSNGVCHLGDAPDLLLKKDNSAIIVEHFEYDSYSAGKKGSQCRRELARIHQKNNSANASKKEICFSDAINGNASFQNLISNLCNSFRTHYQRISQYKENLRSKGLIDASAQVKTMFLLEDTSPLGSFVIDRNNEGSQIHPIIVLLHKEFLDLFSASGDLDYILACSASGNENYVWFADRNEIADYYQHMISYDKMIFPEFNVQTIGFQAKGL